MSGTDDSSFEKPSSSKRFRPLNSDTSDNESDVKPKCSTPKSVLPSVVKKEKVTVEKDLPDPFPLPLHYRPDVELGLSTGKMSIEAKRSFLSSVASSMFTLKKYPTSEEYTRVACEIIKKYPFLKPPTGSPTVSSCIYVFYSL